MMIRLLRCMTLVPLAALLSACASDYAVREPEPIEYGTVRSIEMHRGSENELVNPGTVLGGIAGGVIGHQIGGGSGKTAATIVGAVAGAVVGHAVEDNMARSRYRVTVQLDSGSMVVVEDTRDIELRIGNRVRVKNNHVERL